MAQVCLDQSQKMSVFNLGIKAGLLRVISLKQSVKKIMGKKLNLNFES